jgi:serine/arginine repetitive matrix protein 1
LARALPALANAQVDLRKVNIGVLREWITKRVTEILKIEDDVVIEYAISQIDDAEKPVCSSKFGYATSP